MQGASLPHDDVLDLSVETFRMLADATRLKLLWAIGEGERSVGELTETLHKPQALVSQHLAKLRMAKLVTTRRQGRQIYYRLANDHVRQLIVDGLYHAEHIGQPVPRHHQVEARRPT